MKKRMYQYIVLNDGENYEPTVEQVLEQVAEGCWCYFENCSSQGFVVDEILKQKYADWEMFDEDDAVYIAIQECVENAELEVYRVSIYYKLSVINKVIYFDDDLKQEKQEDTM